jgi:hypothetical protein
MACSNLRCPSRFASTVAPINEGLAVVYSPERLRSRRRRCECPVKLFKLAFFTLEASRFTTSYHDQQLINTIADFGSNGNPSKTAKKAVCAAR